MAQLDLFGFGPNPDTSKKKAKEVAPKKGKALDLPAAPNETPSANLFEQDHFIKATAVSAMPEPADAQLSSPATTAVIVEDAPVQSGPVENETGGEIVESLAAEALSSYNQPNLPAQPLSIDTDDATNPVIFSDGKIRVKFKTKVLKPVEPKPQVKEIVEKPVVVKKIPQKRGRKSFKEIEAEAAFVAVPEDEVLYQKQYYPIRVVAGWFNVNTSLLRFWENEFDILKPRKNRKGDRMFRPEDVKNLQLIYHLLREKKYTIDGAKDFLKTNKKKADTQLQLTQALQKFKSFLLELKANLQS